MSSKFSLTPLALAISLGMSPCIYAANDSVEQAQQQAIQLNIAAGSLAQALTTLGDQAGVAISYHPELAKGVSLPALKGTYTAEAALRKMLVGTGIEVVKRGPRAFALLANKNMTTEQLNKLEIKGAALHTTEGTHSYTTGAMDTATGLGLSIRDTPQSVSVLSRQQLDDQNILSLRDAILSTPGLSAVQGDYAGNSAAYMARGFALNKIMMDGLPVGISGSSSYNGVTDDLAFYDRIEVVRGANGLMQGAGTPSASVNLVRKRPTKEAQTHLSVSAGSWQSYRFDVDASDSLNAAGTVRGRLVAGYEDKDSFIDVLNNKTYLLYGAVEADLSDDTTLFLSGSWRENKGKGINSGIPDAVDGSLLDLPRSTYLGVDSEFEETSNYGVFAELKHEFSSGWELKAAAQMQNMDADFVESYKWYDSSDELRLGGAGFNYYLKRQAADVRLKGEYQLFERDHELLVGVNWSRHRAGYKGGTEPGVWTDTGGIVVDPFNWNTQQPFAGQIDYSTWDWGVDNRETGFFAVTRLNPTDDIAVFLGGRIGNYSTKFANGYAYDKHGVKTPYLGATWAFDENHTVFASYTEIFELQDAEDQNGNLLPPLMGENYEVGVKGEYLNGHLNLSATLFRMTQSNRAVDDLTTQNPCTPGDWGWCQKAAGEIESNGLELELSGEPYPGWNLSAGYSYVLAKYTEDDDASLIGKNYDPTMPTHQLKLATNYQLKGDLAAWNLGGALRYQSEIKRGGWGGSYVDTIPGQSGYTLVNLNTGYRLNNTWKVNFNVDNLFDKEYYAGLGWGTGGRTFGEPRSFKATLRGEF